MSNQYFRYLNLPSLPGSLIQNLNWDFSQYARKTESQVSDAYLWSDDNNQELNSWGRENICADMYFAFQIICKDVPLHKDIATVCKLNYILDPGGQNVYNEWYDDDQSTLLQRANIHARRWHMFKADTYHTVKNIEFGKTRFGITARIFP